MLTIHHCVATVCCVRIMLACGLCIQLKLLVIYRYVQSSVDTALYRNDAEFASPGFLLADVDDLPKPPSPQLTTKQQEQQKPKSMTAQIRKWCSLPFLLFVFRAIALIKGRYRKDPLSQKSAGHMQNRKTKTNTNPSPDPNRYRRRCPEPMLGYRSLYITWQ